MMIRPTASMCFVMLIGIICALAGAPNWTFMTALAGFVMTHMLEIEKRRG